MIFAYICKDILLDLAKKPSIAVQYKGYMVVYAHKYANFQQQIT